MLGCARSVIVIGIRLPDTTFDTAKVTTSETVGPFAFAMYESLRLLGDCACRILRSLQQAGYRAVLTSDLGGLASLTVSPRGLLPDMRANRFAALLAGLGCIGLHGCALTLEYGVRQRFMAIVTDCRLPDDPLCETPEPCSRCDKACLTACPTGAIRGESTEIELQGVPFRIPRVHDLACDWAKRYGLSGEAGPRYLGLDVDVPPPAEPQAQDVAAAAASVNWGVQKRLLSVAEECVRLCPAHRLGR